MAQRQFLASDGTLNAVSQAQREQLDAAFGDKWPTWDWAQARRIELQLLSTERHKRGELPLTPAEEREMRACDEVCNMNNALRLMKGRDYRGTDLFGPTATIDQIHHNQIHALCGCIVNFIFDHNKRDQTGLVHYPHYWTRTCTAHEPLSKDFVAHFWAVTRATIG